VETIHPDRVPGMAPDFRNTIFTVAEINSPGID
jgi:hypothetical protein